MRKPSKMLHLKITILVSMCMVVSRSLGVETDHKCKCFMCLCDVDPHPLPPALPTDHPPPPEREYYPPPSEPEPTPEYYPPPSEPEPTPGCYPPPSEPEPTPGYYYPPPSEPEYYLPPPAEPYEYPWGDTYGPPAPVMGITGTPGQMYPQDRAFNPSSARRSRCQGVSTLVLASSIVAGALSVCR
ncbi:leucine-rich repeat extensin-like protein 1 [Brachypodium distachyon]|nr:leucine-rich repeat extensin-like protein 1 [Brachypodium distachyon]|eukprot:XP_014754398.1 leucine-rich repeat extensin-like protein 1 [Brachypodium distachyon]